MRGQERFAINRLEVKDTGRGTGKGTGKGVLSGAEKAYFVDGDTNERRGATGASAERSVQDSDRPTTVFALVAVHFYKACFHAPGGGGGAPAALLVGRSILLPKPRAKGDPCAFDPMISMTMTIDPWMMGYRWIRAKPSRGGDWHT